MNANLMPQSFGMLKQDKLTLWLGIMQHCISNKKADVISTD